MNTDKIKFMTVTVNYIKIPLLKSTNLEGLTESEACGNSVLLRQI